MDHMCGCPDSLASGIREWLHDGWTHSYPARRRHRRGAGPGHSGTKTVVAIWTITGGDKVFGKEVVSRSRKILTKLAILSGKKVSQPIIYFTR